MHIHSKLIFEVLFSTALIAQGHPEGGGRQEARPQAHQQAMRPQGHQEAMRPQGHPEGRPEAARGHETRGWAERGGYHGYRIPEDRFRGNFGEGHRFHMSDFHRQRFGRYDRFQYGGLWFNCIDPWPFYWGMNDNVWIGFQDGGYFMFNAAYPGQGIALSVTF
jgi:hypothetical protein